MLILMKRADFAASALTLLCFSIAGTNGQENAQLQIPPSLVECYNTSYYMNRDNRLPSNMETLITLIEKVENGYGVNMDMRQIAVGMLHRFRQDGIQRAPGVTQVPGVLPYSPTGFQFPKFRILLSRLLPSTGVAFPNQTLNMDERCSLHFMLSSSFDTRVRGDENTVCNNLAQYRSQRLRRALGLQPRNNNFIGDVEMLDSIQTHNAQRKGAPLYAAGTGQRVNAKSYDYDFGFNEGFDAQYSPNDNTVSQCPVENGAVRTQWGTVSAGNLIAGIAAGLQPQTVQLRTLLALATRRVQNMPQMATVGIDNRWAATLAGDLAEVALVQVPVSSTNTATVGTIGQWNNTVLPKWYFISQRQNMEMTDAEIRGDLDGLIIALNIAQWKNQASNMKLSQLLRMYYSMNGVLNSGIMACNRVTQFQNLDTTTIIAQTSAFAQVLDREMQLKVTLQPDAIASFASMAANALVNYIPSMNDLSCTAGNVNSQDVSQSITPITNIYVFLDTSWPYATVSNYVNYVLENLNINPYASTVTLLAAADGSIIVNTTNLLSDVNEGWNVTTHGYYTTGFSLPTVLTTVQNLTQSLMNAQKVNSTVGGASLVALLVPYMATVSSSDSSYATTQLQYINEEIPDLKFIYYAGGTVSRFSSFVADPTKDLFPLTSGTTNYATSGGPVVARIKQVPRQLINPRCGSSWYTSTWGTDQMAQYARPGIINYYRMSPNYFFGAGSGRYLNIQSQNSQVQFTICSSRSTVLPSQNSTNSGSTDVSCVQLQGNTYSYDLSNSCNGYYTIHQCPPLYISVQAPASTGSTGSSSIVQCTDAACQTPDQARYVMSVVNLGCYSGVAGLTASLATLLLAFVFRQVL